MKRRGILLTNTGTPDSPAVKDLRRYLKSFLGDPRVVRLPRLLWLPILELIVGWRAPYSAKLYEKINTPQGLPLRVIMRDLARNLERQLNVPVGASLVGAKTGHPQGVPLPNDIIVEVGMHYGNPSIEDAIAKLRARNIEELVVIPLYPQYSTATTAASFHKVGNIIKTAPELATSFIQEYATHPRYIAALVKTIQDRPDPKRHLLFSFHGLPQKYIDKGDPYFDLCHSTVQKVVEQLPLAKENWSLAFQSRFGYTKWLRPYTTEVLTELPKRGIGELDVVCPGFAIDCLETLEEIQIRGKETFLRAGGKDLHYIPALNASDEQVHMLMEILLSP